MRHTDNHDHYDTPPHKEHLFSTPRKTPNKNEHSSIKNRGLASGMKPKENPESKKYKGSSHFMKQESPIDYDGDKENEVSPFILSRLEQDYSLVQHLGRGHFSEVGLYQSRLSNELFAIKTTRANRMSVN